MRTLDAIDDDEGSMREKVKVLVYGSSHGLRELPALVDLRRQITDTEKGGFMN